MRESPEIDKTRLPSDTYESWLGNQKKQPGKVRGTEVPAPDSYEAWIEKQVQIKKKKAA